MSIRLIMIDLRRRKDAQERNTVGINLSINKEHYRKLQNRKYVFGVDMSVTVRQALDHFFEKVEDRQIEEYLRKKYDKP